MKQVAQDYVSEATAVVRLVGTAPGGHPSSPGDSAVPDTRRLAGSVRGTAATLKRHEAQDILVDSAGIACKPNTLDSRLLSEKARLRMIDKVTVNTLVRVRHVV